MKAAIAVVAITAVLSGCNASMPAARAPAPGPDPTATCLSTVQDNPNVTILKQRFPLNGNPDSATLDQRSSKELASADEKKAIQALVSIRQLCFDAGTEYRAKNSHPRLEGFLREQNSKFTVLLASLYAGELNYGQFNSQRIALANEMRSKADQIQNQITTQSAQAAQLQAAQQAQQQANFNNAMMLLQLSQPQPVINPQINCTSQRFGNQVQTNCR